MQWLTRYRVRNYVRRSVWLVPTAMIPLAAIAAWIVREIDERTGWHGLNYSADGARTVLSAITPATLTFLVLILSMLLLTVQLASSQLSPRLIGGVLSRRPIKICLAIFVFSHVYSAAALGRIEDRVIQLSVVIAIGLTMVSVGAGLFLVDYLGRELRPVQMLARTADIGRTIVAQVYPSFISSGTAVLSAETSHRTPLPQPFDTITRTGRSGVFLAMDVNGLVAIAEKAGCTIEIVPQVGDFVARDDALFRIRPAGAAALHRAALHTSLAFGDERTAEQDPTFVFRILVDVASKALSPAINDPTTAVLAIDQIHHLLRQVGMRRLDTGEVRDAGGALRLLYRTPDWEDFVLLAVTEIRQYGNQSIQVTRRLRAMLENLIAILPAERAEFLREQSRLLQSAIERHFEEPEDRARARVSDLQGMGGSGNDDHAAAV